MSHQFVPASARLDSLHLSPRWFEQLVVVPLRETDLPAEKTRAALAQLMQEVGAEQTALPAFNFPQELAHRLNSGLATDSQQWRVNFGADDDNYMQGVVAVERPAGGPRSYAVLVHSGAGDSARALHEFVLANPSATAAQLVQTPHYALAAQHAERNALRIAALIGGALTTAGAATIMPVEADRASYRPHASLAPELLARPSLHVVYNCFDTTHLPPSHARNGALLYREDVANVSKTRGEMVKLLDANLGAVIRLRAPDAAATHLVEPIAAARVFERQEDNDAFMSQKRDDRYACRVRAQNHFLTRAGDAPSSNSRVFWRTLATEMPERTDTRLTPHVMIVYGKPARQRAV